MKYKERGITLIALIVTIIVLLLLAGVSISMMTGQEGILTKVNHAKNEHINGEEIEYIEIIKAGIRVSNEGKLTFIDMYRELIRNQNTGRVVFEVNYPNENQVEEKYGKIDEENIAKITSRAGERTDNDSENSGNSDFTHINFTTVNKQKVTIDIITGKTIVNNPKKLVDPENSNRVNNEYWKNYTVIYNANGGKFSDEKDVKEVKDINYGEKIKLLNSEEGLPTRDNYSFIGWSLKSGDSNGVNYGQGILCEISNVIKEKANEEDKEKGVLKLYAVWLNTTYTVNRYFLLENADNDNFEEIKMTPKNCIANTDTDVSTLGEDIEDCEERLAYVSSIRNESGVQESEKIKDPINYPQDSIINLYLYYTREKYTITYDANEGSNAPSETVKKYGQTVNITSNKPNRTGYKLEKWNTLKNGSGVDYNPSELYDGNVDLTLYAQWTPETYMVSFDSKGGSSCTAQNATYNSKYGTLPTPTKTGQDFDGWYKEEAFTNKVTSDTTVSTTSNHTLYAKWKPKTYTVTYSGSNITKTNAPTTATHGTAFSATVKANSGYYITGYSVTTGGTTLTAGTHYTFNTSTGALNINAANITGNISISISTTTGQAYGLVPTVLYRDYADGVHNIEINGVTYTVHVINYRNDVTYTQNTNLGSSSDINTNMVIAKYHGNLTINSGVTLSSVDASNGGPKGMFICVKGTLTNNGTITMTARGANAAGQNVYLYSPDSSWATSEYVPAAGGGGGGGYYASCSYPNYSSEPGGTNGGAGSGRATGGGGSGEAMARYKAGVTSGSGSAGTSYSGGSGGGGAQVTGGGGSTRTYVTAGSAAGNGGAGGNAATAQAGSSNPAHGASGGAGNPGGSASISGTAGGNGTGGLLILYANTILNNTGAYITSNGTNGGSHSAYYSAAGGSSGGGSINIYHNSNGRYTNSGTVQCVGGSRRGNYQQSGAGGNGTVTSASVNF